MRREKVWINGRLADARSAGISVFDRGFMYGDGVFETMRCYAGKIFMASEHISRLYDGMKAIRIKAPLSKRALGEAVYRTIGANRLKSAYVKVNVTRGEGRSGMNSANNFKPNVVVTAKEYEGCPSWIYRKGISAKVIDLGQNEKSPLAGIKSMNYLTHILARIYAGDAGRDEAIMKNAKGHITEGASSNVFIVKNGGLVTPSIDSGILKGITRGLIIKMALNLRIKVSERLVRERELFSADEVFLTNSLAEVIPVTRVNSGKIGSGLPGEITKLLRISYQKAVIKSTL